MALNSRGTIVHEHGKEHDYLMEGKTRGTQQALCCAVVDYLVYLRASGRKATTIGSYGESLALLGRKMGTDIPLLDVSPACSMRLLPA